MNIKSSFEENPVPVEVETFEKELKKSPWSSIDETFSISFDDMTYELKNGEISESGVYSINKIGEYIVLQVRSDSDFSMFQEYYSLNFGQKVITETVRKKTVERTVTDYDSITCNPVKITPTDCFAAEGKLLNLVRNFQ